MRRSDTSCGKCGREVVAHAKFCSYCGERVSVACPSCDTVNPADGVFCHDCGQSLGGDKSRSSDSSVGEAARQGGFGSGSGSGSRSGMVESARSGYGLQESVETGSASGSQVGWEVLERSGTSRNPSAGSDSSGMNQSGRVESSRSDVVRQDGFGSGSSSERQFGRGEVVPRGEFGSGSSSGSRVGRGEVVPQGGAGVGCPRCNTVNEPGSVYCYSCGLPLEDDLLDTRRGYGGQIVSVGAYKSLGGRAGWTIGLLVATCLGYALTILADFNLLALVSEIDAGRFVSVTELEDALLFSNISEGLGAIAFIASVVLFLMWMYRASKNLASLGLGGQRFSPWWAVGWWFIPIAHLFMPYQVMAEIWRGSHSEGSAGWRDGSVSGLVLLWWGFWVLYIVTSVVAPAGISVVIDGWGLETTELVPSRAELGWSLMSNGALICSGVLAIMVVRQISGRQEARRRVLMGVVG